MKKIISVLFFCLLFFACNGGKGSDEPAATAPTATASVVAPVPATDVADVVITYRVKQWGNYYYADSSRISRLIANELTQKVGLKRVEVFDTANSTLPAATVGKFLVEDTGEQIAAGFILKVHWQPAEGAPRDYDIVLYYKNDKMSVELWEKCLGELFPPNPEFEVRKNFKFKEEKRYIPLFQPNDVGIFFAKDKNGLMPLATGAVYKMSDNVKLISRTPFMVATLKEGSYYLEFSFYRNVAAIK